MILDIRDNYIENFLFPTPYNDIFKGKYFGQKRPPLGESKFNYKKGRNVGQENK